VEISDLISAESIVIGQRARDKQSLLQELSARAAASLGLDPKHVLVALSAREMMGSTGVGQGVAIPHARMEGIVRPFGLFARLEKPLDFAAIDQMPVDLVCLLLTPASDPAQHLPALATLARRLREKGVAEGLRRAKDAGSVHAILTSQQAR